MMPVEQIEVRAAGLPVRSRVAVLGAVQQSWVGQQRSPLGPVGAALKAVGSMARLVLAELWLQSRSSIALHSDRRAFCFERFVS